MILGCPGWGAEGVLKYNQLGRKGDFTQTEEEKTIAPWSQRGEQPHARAREASSSQGWSRQGMHSPLRASRGTTVPATLTSDQ